MQALARVRFSLLGQDGPDRQSFWRLYRGSSELGRGDAEESEERLRYHFGPHLQEVMERTGISGIPDTDKVRIEVVGIRYGSIELLLSVIGGEELASEMFWSAMEFFSSEAFTDLVGRPSVDMRAQIIDRTVTNANPPFINPTPTRAGKFETIARSPLAAWILLGVSVIYFLGLRVDALEKETMELHHDYTALLEKVMDQNTALATKSGIDSLKPGTAQPAPAPASPTPSAPTSPPASVPTPPAHP